MRPLTIFANVNFIQPYIPSMPQKGRIQHSTDRLISTVQFFHNGKELRTQRKLLLDHNFWHQYPGIQKHRLY